MDSADDAMHKLTLFVDLDGPYSVGCPGKTRVDQFLYIETVPQSSERTPRTTSTSSQNLRSVRGYAQQIRDLGVDNRIERVHGIGKEQVLEWSRGKVCEGQGLIGHSVVAVVRRDPFLVVLIVTQTLEVVKVAKTEIHDDIS